jgi:hypothetical protein
MSYRLQKQSVSPPSRGRYWWLAGIAAIYSALIYLNALHNPYVYDDNRTVLNNTSIEDISNVRHIVFREMTRPVVNFSYALDRAIWPVQPFGHHTTSLLLHIINVLLVFRLAWVATLDRRAHAPPGPSSEVTPTIAAFVTASLFGLHPLQTESVGYISGRSELVYSLFFLLALLAARRWILGDGRRWLGTAIGLWVVSLLSKEVAVLWPVIVALYDRYVLGSPKADWQRRFRRVYLPMLALTAIAAAIRVGVLLVVEHSDNTGIIWRFAPVEIVVAFRYFRLLLAPSGQSIFHQVQDVTRLSDPLLLMALAWLVLWIALAVRIRRIDGAAALGMIWFVVLLIPSAMLVLLDLGEPMAEHRVYLSSAGMFLAVGTLFGRAWPLFGSRVFRYGLLCKFLLATWLTVLGGMTVLRNEVWKNPIRLWLSAVQQAPDIWVPHVALGEALENAGSPEAAVAEYRLAVHLRPTEPVPYMKLGLALAGQRRLDEAAAAFRALERVMPGSAVARNGLGAVAMLEGRYEEARQHYHSALAAHPKDVAARQSLAMIAETIDHDPAEALRLCEEVARLAPETQGINECISRNRARGGGSESPSH